MIIGVHHVQLTVPNGQEAAARAFYCGVLGLSEVEKPDALAGRGGFWLQAGDRQVHVGTEDGVDRAATKAHVAYAVTNIAPWRRNLQREGIEVLEGVPIPGHYRVEFRDPFGNRVELIQPLGRPSPPRPAAIPRVPDRDPDPAGSPLDGLRFDVTEHLDDVLTEGINARLREHNLTHSPAFWAALDRPEGRARPLNVVAYDAAGRAVGGLLGETRLSWLKVAILSVDGGCRRRGIGTGLVRAAEAEALRRGCKYAYVDTMGHQAPAFYESLGYGLAGRLDDWDSHGDAKFFFVRPLAPPPEPVVSRP